MFIYIGESRSFSVNRSNDIASINKEVKSVNGCLEAKNANIATIINDNLKCFPLLLFVLEAVNSRTKVKPKQLV